MHACDIFYKGGKSKEMFVEFFIQYTKCVYVYVSYENASLKKDGIPIQITRVDTCIIHHFLTPQILSIKFVCTLNLFVDSNNNCMCS